eukprot:437563-Pelagomonas_calceolata.AAC.8
MIITDEVAPHTALGQPTFGKDFANGCLRGLNQGPHGRKALSKRGTWTCLATLVTCMKRHCPGCNGWQSKPLYGHTFITTMVITALLFAMALTCPSLF